jgi:hypothetical protein
MWRMLLHERNGNQAANLVQSGQETKLATVRVSEIVLPGFEVLNAVEKHSVPGEEPLLASSSSSSL